MTNAFWRSRAFFALFLALVPLGRGQTDAPTSQADPAVAQADSSVTPVDSRPAHRNGTQPSLFRMPGFFEIEMPKTTRRGEVTFDFQPRFRDLINQDYLRIPLEFRWGVNNHFEINFTADSYVDNVFRQSHSGSGFSAVHFGTKYAWHQWLRPTWDTSVGFNSSYPVSRPPIQLTDGHNHFTPYIVLGRKIDDINGLSGLITVSVDLLSKSSTPGNFGRNEPHGKSFTVRPGLLYDRGPWHYTLEVGATTTRFIGGGDHDFLQIRPGVFWDLPKRLVFHARGRWVAGFNVTATFGPDGNTLSTGGRFRGEINLTRMFNPERHEPTPQDTLPSAH
jgi:hypothetical protein